MGGRHPSKGEHMTPEQTLDWLAQQHFDQCREDRPVQYWIRKMKSQLPSENLGLAMGLNDADFAIYQRGYDKGHAEGMVAGKKPNIPSPQSPQPEERNFCPRCGKRTADPTTIHTCTPPKDAR